MKTDSGITWVIMDTLSDIADECERQQKLWGEQNHWDVNPQNLIHYAHQLQDFRDVNDAHDNSYWDEILGEEFYEALTAESDEDRIRELTEVAAVCVTWIEAIKRRKATNGTIRSLHSVRDGND